MRKARRGSQPLDRFLALMVTDQIQGGYRMEQSEATNRLESQSASAHDTQVTGAFSASPAAISPQSCSTCGASESLQNVPAVPIYALGKIEPRLPTPALEKEFAQVVGRDDAKGLTDAQVRQKILSDLHSRYLVRKMCWVLTIQGLDTYVLVPSDPVDFDLLVESIRPAPRPSDLDVVIGLKGPIAPPDMCNGLMVPVVAFDQIYSFDRDALMKSIPKPEKMTAKEFAPAAEELFDRILQMTDNAGAIDDHRALNYLAVRYHRVYAAVAEAFARNESLTAVDVHLSPLTARVRTPVFDRSIRSSNAMSRC
jgi:hypothetical protein